MITLKRVYEPYDSADGYRILIDRLWPRGLTKAEAHVDLWLKDIAPSTELRKWFGHDPKRWLGFEAKYRQELQSKQDLLSLIKQTETEHGKVTLLYGAKDTQHNQAVVIAQLLS